MRSLSVLGGVMLAAMVTTCDALLAKTILIQKSGHYLQLSQVGVYNKRGENIGLGKSCTATKGWMWQTHGESQCGWAVDGYMGVRGNPDKYYHSSSRSNSEWKLDLGGDVDIDHIVVYNRADCCSSRLNGAVIELSNGEGNVLYRSTLNGDQEQTLRPHGARKVRITKSGDYLQLSQVAVYNMYGVNIAEEMPCTSSNGFRWTNERGVSQCGYALDGHLGVRGDPDYYYHSAGRSSNFWMVDLGSEIEVEKVVIYNRDKNNCCDGRLNGARLELLNNFDEVVFETGLDGSQVQTHEPVLRMGCYKDSGDRDLPNNVWNSDSVTVESCSDHCRTQGYVYFGVQWYKQCWCGNSFGKHGRRNRRPLQYSVRR